jgi:hypothetical protein
MAVLAAGLLGVDVTELVEMGASHATITNARLEEIERRILALEAALRHQEKPDALGQRD